MARDGGDPAGRATGRAGLALGQPLDPARRASMLAVISCISTYGIMLGLSWPLLSLILEARGVSSSMIGLNAAMMAFGTIVVAPFVPGWLTRFGARTFSLACILMEATLFLALPLFDNLWAWFFIRFLMGASGTALFVASETWINQLADTSNRGRWMGLYNTVISATIALGPLIVVASGTQGWLPFVIGASFILTAAIPLIWATEMPAFEERSSPLGLAEVMGEAPTLGFAMLLMSIVYMAGSALLPVYGVRLGFTEDQSAMLVAVMLGGSVFAQWPAGWACDRWQSRRTVLVLFAGGGAICGATIPWLYSTWLVWPAVFLWGGLSLSVYTVMMTMAGDRFTGTRLAQVMAAFGVLWGVGSLLGPGVGGVLMDQFGPHGLPLGLAAAGLAFAVFAASRGRRKEQGGTG